MNSRFKPSVSTGRITATEMTTLARADPSVPPAFIRDEQTTSGKNDNRDFDEIVQFNVRIRRSLADELADRAATEQVSQRVLICRALQAAGFTVAPADLTDRVVRRRRGSQG